jgi:acetate kinase
MSSTRPGDLDASVPLYLLSRGHSLAEVENMLQKGSGIVRPHIQLTGNRSSWSI